jgi:hypothetical protein
MRKPYLLLLLLICAPAFSGCAANGPGAKPSACPTLPPPPPNVMRSPQNESALRALLFESAETPTTRSEPSRP